MNKTQYRICAELIDEIDELIIKSRRRNKKYNQLVLSTERVSGPKSDLFKQKKIQLLQQLSETFIEPKTKSLRFSALLIFCHESGLKLVTQKCRPYSAASFTVRTPGFDLVVKSPH